MRVRFLDSCKFHRRTFDVCQGFCIVYCSHHPIENSNDKLNHQLQSPNHRMCYLKFPCPRYPKLHRANMAITGTTWYGAKCWKGERATFQSTNELGQSKSEVSWSICFLIYLAKLTSLNLNCFPYLNHCRHKMFRSSRHPFVRSETHQYWYGTSLEKYMEIELNTLHGSFFDDLPTFLSLIARRAPPREHSGLSYTFLSGQGVQPLVKCLSF